MSHDGDFTWIVRLDSELKRAASVSNVRARVAVADHLEQWFINLVFAASAL